MDGQAAVAGVNSSEVRPIVQRAFGRYRGDNREPQLPMSGMSPQLLSLEYRNTPRSVSVRLYRRTAGPYSDGEGAGLRRRFGPVNPVQFLAFVREISEFGSR